MGYHTYFVLSESPHVIADSMKIGNNVGLGSHGYYEARIGCLEISDNTIFLVIMPVFPLESHITDKLDVPIRLLAKAG